MDRDRVVAVGLLTARDLELLGQGFTRMFPVDDTPIFTQLLRAIDEADTASRAAEAETGSLPPLPSRRNASI